MILIRSVVPTAVIGTIFALVGVLTLLMVGLVFADLWASSRSAEKHAAEPTSVGREPETSDPFEEEI